MNPVIKRGRVIEQPLILTRGKRQDGRAFTAFAARPAEIAAADASDLYAPGVGVAPTSPAQPAFDEQAAYAAYRRRFEEELRRLETQAVEEGFEKGRQEGFDQGLTQGREQAAAEQAERLDALANVLASARASLERAIEGTENVGVEIVYEAITRILGEAAGERETAVSMVREVIRRARERSRLVVRVSSADCAQLASHRERMLDGFNAGVVDIVADDTVRLGGCVLETPAGDLDGRLETQLRRLREALLAAHRAPPTETGEP